MIGSWFTVNNYVKDMIEFIRKELRSQESKDAIETYLKETGYPISGFC